MGFLKRLFGDSAPATADNEIRVERAAPTDLGDARGRLPDNVISLYAGLGGIDVVGESHYRDAIDRVVRGPYEGGVRATYWAQLVREPNNPYDPFAVAIHINGEKVGHLSKGDAKRYCPALDSLMATGRPVAVRCDVGYGWSRPGEERGHYSLRVYMDTPEKQTELLGPGAPPVPSAPERPYANSACPTCGVELDPPPKSKRKCPSCKAVIYVRSFPDGRRHLLNEDTHKEQEAASAREREAKKEEREAKKEAKRKQWMKDAARETRAELAELRRDGVEEILIVVDEEKACAACRTLADKGWPIKEVPKLPYKDCTNEYCRCDYEEW